MGLAKTKKSAAKKTLAKKAAASKKPGKKTPATIKVSVMTHAQMTKGFKESSKKFVILSKKGKGSIKRAKASIKVKPLSVAAFKADKSKLNKKKFGPFFRNLAPEMDELVSTSSVGDMLDGAVGSKVTFTPAESKTLDEFFNAVSEVRFPTEYSGFAKKGSSNPKDRMQHPTAKGKGMWRKNILKGDKNPHSEMDRLRRQEVFFAMKESVEKGKDLQSVLNATLARAISFTLNEFTAPATASDQAPDVTNKEAQYQQVKAREQLKEIGIKYGLVQETGNTDRGRAWGSRSGKRSVSPRRTLKPADEKAVRK